MWIFWLRGWSHLSCECVILVRHTLQLTDMLWASLRVFPKVQRFKDVAVQQGFKSFNPVISPSLINTWRSVQDQRDKYSHHALLPASLPPIWPQERQVFRSGSGKELIFGLEVQHVKNKGTTKVLVKVFARFDVLLVKQGLNYWTFWQSKKY